MKKLSAQYLLFLAVLTLVIVVSQVLIQKTISDSKSDSRIINISGRQRMLSQKITKSALKLQISGGKEDFDSAMEELVMAADLLEQSHNDLKFGSSQIDVSEMNNSVSVNRLFALIEPFFEQITSATDEVRKTTYQSMKDSVARAEMMDHIKVITSKESEFLRLMNDITFEYDRISSKRVEKISSSEYYLLAFTLFLIVVEAVFIYRPVIKKVSKTETEISGLHDYVQQSIRVIGNSQKEKKFAASQISEANRTIEELKEKNSELIAELSRLSKPSTKKKGDSSEDSAVHLSEENSNFKKKIKFLQEEIERLKMAM